LPVTNFVDQLFNPFRVDPERNSILLSGSPVSITVDLHAHRRATPKGWTRKARGANPGKEGQDEASTLKGLNSLRAADTDFPARW